MRINEIFYSLQGEGHFTGHAAVFVRLSGCNLRCDFCDTRHESGRDMTVDEILQSIDQFESRHVVITGGEPSLQLTEEFVDRLHDRGWYVQVETNGTHPAPANVDWITCSPKGAPIVLDRINELKVVYWGQDITTYEQMNADEYRLQPCDTGDALRNAENISLAVCYIKSHPLWVLSLQTHKLIQIP